MVARTKLTVTLSKTMLFLPLVKIQQSPSRGLFTGRVSVLPFHARVGEEQSRQPLKQRPGCKATQQQGQCFVLDRVEGHCPVHCLRMPDFLGIKLGLRRGGQDGFQAGQVHRGVEV